MITELGHFALILAFLVSLVQMVMPLVGAHKRWPGWMAVAEPAATLQLLLVASSFAALTYAFVVSDFSLKLVYENSHSAKPMLYKISGVWGNHEGSMLLWVLILALFGAMAAWFGGNLPPTLKARVLAVQSAVAVAFFAFILFTSNPFLRLAVPPFDGQDLNPLLQDPGLAFHPPFLYLGYVGLSICFSFAVAALIEGRVDAAWGRWVRPWTLAAWLFLTIDPAHFGLSKAYPERIAELAVSIVATAGEEALPGERKLRAERRSLGKVVVPKILADDLERLAAEFASPARRIADD